MDLPTIHELRIDAMNTTTPNLADEPTLPNRPPPKNEHGFLEDNYTKNYLEVCSYLSGDSFLANGSPKCSWIS